MAHTPTPRTALRVTQSRVTQSRVTQSGVTQSGVTQSRVTQSAVLCAGWGGVGCGVPAGGGAGAVASTHPKNEILLHIM